MNIHRLLTHQVYLVKHDQIPLMKIVHPKGSQAISSMFSFAQASVNPGASGMPEVMFQIGSFGENESQVPIIKLMIEERRIIIDAEGDSSAGDGIYKIITEFFRTLTGRKDTDFLEPIILAQESEIIAELNFPANKLISPQLDAFINADLQGQISSDIATSSVNFSQVAFLVQYNPSNFQLDDYRINLSRKEILIGPRPGFPLSDQVYYSKAPLDSATHVKLLQDLEMKFQS